MIYDINLEFNADYEFVKYYQIDIFQNNELFSIKNFILKSYKISI